jgi:AcrR family transcriptional regulator
VPQAQGEIEVREREPLTRRRILRAALDLMDREGVEAVSMRRLGRELGVEAMSLYHHVQDKGTLLVGVIETVFEEFRMPQDTPGHWTERLRALGLEFRRLLLEHPGVMRLMAEDHGPPTSAAAYDPMEAALSTLRGAGLSPEATVHAYQALVGFVMGHVTLELGGLFTQGEEKAHWADLEGFLRSEAPGRFESMIEMAPYLMYCDTQAEFEYGLDMLLAGLEAKLGA